MITAKIVMLKDAIKQAKLTQQQFTERYGIPRTTLQDWLANKHLPPEYMLNLLLRCIEVDYDIVIEDKTKTIPQFTITYLDGTPLSLYDDMYVYKARQENRVHMVKSVSERVFHYKCDNGLVIKVVKN